MTIKSGDVGVSNDLDGFRSEERTEKDLSARQPPCKKTMDLRPLSMRHHHRATTSSSGHRPPEGRFTRPARRRRTRPALRRLMRTPR